MEDEDLVKEEVETATVTLSGAENAGVEEEEWYRTLDEFLKMEPEDGDYEGEFAEDFDINLQQIVAQQGDMAVDLNQQTADLPPKIDQSTVDDEFDNQDEFTEELGDNVQQIDGLAVVSDATNEKQTNSRVEEEINADETAESEHNTVVPSKDNVAMIINVKPESGIEHETIDITVETAESEPNPGSPRNDNNSMINVESDSKTEQEINADEAAESEHNSGSPRTDNNAMITNVEPASETEHDINDEAAKSDEHNTDVPRKDNNEIINLESDSETEQEINDEVVESANNTGVPSKDIDAMVIDVASDSESEHEINDEAAESEHNTGSPKNDNNAMIIEVESESETEHENNDEAVESAHNADSPSNDIEDMIINVEPVKEMVEEILLQIEERNAMQIVKEEEEEAMTLDVTPSSSGTLRRSTRAKRGKVNYAGADEEPVKGKTKAPSASRPKRQSTLPAILQPRLPKTKTKSPIKPKSPIKTKSPPVVRSKRKSTLPQKIPQPQHSHSSYQCQDCGKEFATLWPLNRHRKTVHFGERLYPCPECDKRFKESDQLKRHLKDSHVEVKPFECGRCEKRFSRQTDLKRHRETHDPAETRYKPYECPLDGCERAFTLASDLRAHLHVHSGKRPFKCPDCGKAFGKEGNLKVHRRTHSGERPYSCSVCEKSFGHSSDVRRHLRKVHGVEP